MGLVIGTIQVLAIPAAEALSVGCHSSGSSFDVTCVGYKMLERMPPRQGPDGMASVSNLQRHHDQYPMRPRKAFNPRAETHLASAHGAASSPLKLVPEKQRKQVCDFNVFAGAVRLFASPTSIRNP